MSVWTGTHVDLPPEAVELVARLLPCARCLRLGGPSATFPAENEAGAPRAPNPTLLPCLSRRRTIRRCRSVSSRPRTDAPASQALRDAVAARNADALAPVTVVVPTNSVGVSARAGSRRASSGRSTRAGPRRRRRQLPHRVPARGAARRGRASRPRAGGRCRRLSSLSAVRRALRREPGLFAPVARAPATEEALVAAHRELADLDDAQLDVLAAQHHRARDVVRLHRSTTSLAAAGWYDEHDSCGSRPALVARAARSSRELGTIVCSCRSVGARRRRGCCARSRNGPTSRSSSASPVRRGRRGR